MFPTRGLHAPIIFWAFLLLLPATTLGQPYDYWQSMLHTEALQWPVPGHVAQFSSYARNGSNSDLGWYYGTDRGWNILCDVRGAGVITQFWFTYRPFSDTNRVRIFVDDTVTALIDTPMVRFFGRMSPFNPPLADSASGSWYCHVPIPFSTHARITYHGTLIYNHVEALVLDAGRTVTSLTMPPSAAYLAKLDSLRNRFSNPTQPAWITKPYQVVDTQATLQSGASSTVLVRSGEGGVRRLLVRVGDHSQATLENIWVRIFTDYSPAPDLNGPLSALFGAVQGWWPYRSAYLGMMGDSLYLNLPITYQKKLKIELFNGTSASQSVRLIAEIVALSPSDVGPFKLRGIYHIENPTRAWSPYTPCSADGAGTLLGIVLDMRGPQTYILEGDETMYADGNAQPFWHGTGTDDYFLSGYYWGGGAIGCTALGFQGCIRYAGANIAAYRWNVCDPVPFRTGLRVNFDVGAWDQVVANYRSEVFYFAERRKWEVADSSGDGQSTRGEALYMTGHHIPPGTTINSVRWGTNELTFMDSLRVADADSIVQFAVRSPLGFQQGCQPLTVLVGAHRDTVSPFCWTHLAGSELLFVPRRADIDTFQSRGDTLNIEIHGLVPGATAQLFAGGYPLSWSGTPPIIGTDGSLHGLAVIVPPLFPGDYEISATSAGSPVAQSNRLLKLRSFYRMEVEELDTSGWQGTVFQTRYAQDYTTSNNTDPWGRGLVRYLQGNGVGTFVNVRFSVAVPDTYQLAYFFGRTGGGAQIRTTLDSTIDLDSYDSYFATSGLWRYIRSDTVRGTWHWLSAGRHTLRFEMVGRNASANGWQAILDQIILSRDLSRYGTVPLRVTNPTAYRVDSGVRLLWRPVTADTAGHPLVVHSYGIYRAVSHDSVYHYLTEVSGTQTSFIDTNLSFIDGGAVFYVVTARTGITLTPAVIRVWDRKDVAPADAINERRR